MPPKKWIVFDTKHPLFGGIGDFVSNGKYIKRGMIGMPACHK